MSVHIFAATHGPTSFPLPEGYSYLLVGSQANKKNMSKHVYKDNDFKGNISWKNPYYCELTGLYWEWKRCQSKIKGLVHYRRFFQSPQNEKDINDSPILSCDEIRFILDRSDAIVARREYLSFDLRSHYYNCHHIEDLFNLRSILKKHCPDYLEAFDRVLLDNRLSPYNMIIAKSDVFDSYCSWLFPLLEKCENIINPSVGSNRYQARVFGFLAERLLNVFIDAKRLNVFECPIWSPEQSIIKQAADQKDPRDKVIHLIDSWGKRAEASDMFDYNYYLEHNQDLADYVQGDIDIAKKHYFNQGIYEHRQGSPYFSMDAYLDSDPEMRKACRNRMDKVVESFTSLCASNPPQAPFVPFSKHKTIGTTVLDGFDWSPVYDYSFYVDKYPDAPADYWNTDTTLNHFLEVGVKEGRQGCAFFDPKEYRDLFPALNQKYGNDWEKYYANYLTSLKTLKRIMRLKSIFCHTSILDLDPHSPRFKARAIH